MKKTLFLVFSIFAVFCTAAEKLDAIYGEVYLHGKRDHIQGICADENAIYLGCNRNIIKLDWQGRELRRLTTPDHTGDLCMYEGRIYSSFSCKDRKTSKKYGYIIEYSSDLVEQRRLKLDFGIDGIAVLDGWFFCGVGGMGAKFHRVNKIARIPVDFSGKADIFDTDCGYETMFGPQAICSVSVLTFLSTRMEKWSI